MQTFLIGVLGSLVAAVLWGFFLAPRVEQLREVLKNRSSGWFRGRLIKAFVGAVRGKATALDSGILVFVVVIGVYALGLYVGTYGTSLSERYARLQSAVAEKAIDSPALTTKADSLRWLTQTAESLRRQRVALRWTQDSLRVEVATLQPQVSLFVRGFRLASVGLIALAVWGFTYWVPFVMIRSLFAHEISRFSLRIQGMASKSELISLTSAELSVSDESSLRAYVRIMKGIAARHGVPDLTRSFEIWPD